MSKDGFASGFAFGYDPTGRSVIFFKIDRSTQKLTTGRIHYFDIRHSIFDIRFQALRAGSRGGPKPGPLDLVLYLI